MAECERILHVLNSMNCGGAENLIMNIYRNIDRNKIQFDFLVNFSAEMYFQTEIEQLGGRIYRMKSLLKSTPPVYKRQLAKFFRKHREYRIIHSHLETTTGIILEQAKKEHVPVRIAHAHNTRHTRSGGLYALENAYKNYCRTKIQPSATALLACSHPAAQWLFRGKADEASIIKNGIDTDRFRYNPDTRRYVQDMLGITGETAVFVHTGRFYDQKNHTFLIDVFAEYKKINPDSLLLLLGEGPLLEHIKKKSAEKNILDTVIFLGLRDDVHDILQRADAFLLPSKFEGLPLALVEAQCSGVCCYVSDFVPKESDLGCGLVTFLPVKSPLIWAKNIQIQTTDRNNAHEKAAEGGFDIKATAKQMEDMYFEMLLKA